ncbi:MAG: DNA polymerase III subunit epsilon [Acidobacteria bacterium]|nr:MAG: DNA polymerase III subunit epsilon [Acidobacteriota bacterium]
MTREIILDTETTGLDPVGGDRVIEIAAIELINRSSIGNIFHKYINPERDIPDSATKVHGISFEMVVDQPRFFEIADQLVSFVGSDPIVAHNAEFDIKFINSELIRARKPQLMTDRVIDTLSLARKLHPGSSNSLDALCVRYGVDRSRRVRHGALIDAEILVEVYIELNGGRQTSLSLQIQKVARKARAKAVLSGRKQPLPSAFETMDIDTYKLLVENLGSRALWRRYFDVLIS